MNSSVKKQPIWNNKNPYEHDIKETTSNIRDLLSNREKYSSSSEKAPASGPINQEIFSFKNHHESKVIPQEIQQLKEEIKREVKQLKAVNNSVTAQIADIEKETLSSVTHESKIYDLRFLETLLSMIRLLRTKVSEAGNWLAAMQTKKAKRGSLYQKQTKKGAKDSVTHMLSQEKSSARSIQ